MELNIKTSLETHGKVKTKKMLQCFFNPFVNSLHFSFSNHKPLVLSPDMIWLLICQGMAIHTRQNSESLRDKLVSHDGKKTITIIDDINSEDKEKVWKTIVSQFSDSLKTHSDTSLHRLMIPTFTTTLPNYTTSYQICMMDALSPYFEYRVETFCGIPSIKLEGTTADWQWILDHVKEFDKYELEWWTKQLIPILTEFRNASENKIDVKFWKSIYKYNSESGGEYVSGWIGDFFPYIDYGNNDYQKNTFQRVVKTENFSENGFRGISISSFPSGFSSVDFVWKVGGVDNNMVFQAGFVGVTQNKKQELRAEINWGIAKK